MNWSNRFHFGQVLMTELQDQDTDRTILKVTFEYLCILKGGIDEHQNTLRLARRALDLGVFEGEDLETLNAYIHAMTSVLETSAA